MEQMQDICRGSVGPLPLDGANSRNYKFENILPGMRRKVNISTLMVFRNQRRRREEEEEVLDYC